LDHPRDTRGGARAQEGRGLDLRFWPLCHPGVDQLPELGVGDLVEGVAHTRAHAGIAQLLRGVPGRETAVEQAAEEVDPQLGDPPPAPFAHELHRAAGTGSGAAYKLEPGRRFLAVDLDVGHRRVVGPALTREEPAACRLVAVDRVDQVRAERALALGGRCACADRLHDHGLDLPRLVTAVAAACGERDRDGQDGHPGPETPHNQPFL
jgi:hypothetical protein